MGLREVIQKKIPAELFTQLVDALGDDFDFDYVPRNRLNKVIAERNELRGKVQSSTSDEDSLGKASEGQDTQLTQADIDKLISAAVTKEKQNAMMEVEKVKLQYAVTEKLREAKVRNPELLIPQLKMDGLKADDLSGLTGQLDTWKKSAPYLFGEEVPTGTGASGKGAEGGEAAALQASYDAAVKAGNTEEAVRIKNSMYKI